jgi:hypothetical protein
MMTDEQTRVETTNLIMSNAAGWWTRFMRPVAYDRVFHVSGVRVRVRVEEYRTPGDTQPVYGRREPEELED